MNPNNLHAAIETYEGLHHLVSSVTGELKDGLSATCVLKACFPGGYFFTVASTQASFSGVKAKVAG